MNTIARLWREKQINTPGWDRFNIAHKSIIRKAFIAGCEAMRDEIHCPEIEAERVPENQLGLHLVGGSDSD